MEIEFLEHLILLHVIDGDLVLTEWALIIALGFSASDVEDRPFRNIEFISFFSSYCHVLRQL